MDKKHARPIDSGIFENTRLGVITVASKPDNRYFLEGCKAAGVPVAFGMKDDMDAFPVDFLRELLESSTIIFTNEVERELLYLQIFQQYTNALQPPTQELVFQNNT